VANAPLAHHCSVSPGRRPRKPLSLRIRVHLSICGFPAASFRLSPMIRCATFHEPNVRRSPPPFSVDGLYFKRSDARLAQM